MTDAPVRRRTPKQTWRHRRAWRPTRPPFGYEDLPGRAESAVCEETGEFRPPNRHVAVRAVTWDLRHPRDLTAIEVLRDPATMPWELGWEAAHALVDAYATANALAHSHPATEFCNQCHKDELAELDELARARARKKKKKETV